MFLALVLLCCIVRCHPTRHAWVDAFEVGNAVTSLLPPVLFFVLQAATGGISGPVFNGYAPNGTMLLNFSGLDQAMAVATSVFPGVEVNSYGGLSIEGVASNADIAAVLTDRGIEFAMPSLKMMMRRMGARGQIKKLPRCTWSWG